MIMISNVQVTTISSENGLRYSIEVDFVEPGVTIHHLNNDEGESPSDVQSLAEKWNTFAKNEGFTKMGVETPEDASKCVIPF